MQEGRGLLRYARTDEGCVVYSVGQNGRDDGGECDWTADDGPDDIAFRLFDVDRRNQPQAAAEGATAPQPAGG